MPKSLLLMGNHPELDMPKDAPMRHDETWVCNDWWRVRPATKVDRCFQMHVGLNLDSPSILPGWREWYPYVPRLIVADTHGLSNETVIHPCNPYWDKFNPCFYLCSAGYMFSMALQEGFADITMAGFRLGGGGEYQYQRPSMLINIDIAREHGVSVKCHWEDMWRRTEKDIDWASIRCVSMKYGEDPDADWKAIMKKMVKQ